MQLPLCRSWRIVTTALPFLCVKYSCKAAFFSLACSFWVVAGTRALLENTDQGCEQEKDKWLCCIILCFMLPCCGHLDPDQYRFRRLLGCVLQILSQDRFSFNIFCILKLLGESSTLGFGNKLWVWQVIERGQ